VEAKEGVQIQSENQTLASITFQNYFRMYAKLGGMTGTADTEAYEFQEIYGLETVVIPPNRPTVRKDELDLVYKTTKEKYDAVTKDIQDCHQRGQPVLVGTTSIENSETVSELLQKAQLPHQVLNAKQHAKEAEIVAQAGRPGVITIATNMAGRGTDIVLGGNVEKQIQFLEADDSVPADEKARRIQQLRDEWAGLNAQVKAAGGLRIIATERHESRRIDNQLRGRSGRQGDPGHSAFFLSLQDDLMRIFPVESMDSMLGKLGLEQGESITHPWVTKAIERAQGKVEARNFDIRKNILKYDDVMNDQRKVIFEQRLEMMDAEDVSETVVEMRHDLIETLVAKAIPARSYPEQWNTEQLEAAAKTYLNLDVPVKAWAEEEGIDAEIVTERLIEAADAAAAAKEAQTLQAFEAAGTPNPTVMRQVEKTILLQSIDGLWREHLVTLDHLSKVVGWRGIAQRDPLNEYKQEAYELFQALLTNMRELVTTQLSHVVLQPRPVAPPAPDFSRIRETHIDPLTGENDADGGDTIADSLGAVGSDPSLRPVDPKLLVGVSRNAPCPCGSGKKFKHCHGAF
jgi:preprotein translocase subunit SecA